jgi:hypothetical protein
MSELEKLWQEIFDASVDVLMLGNDEQHLLQPSHRQAMRELHGKLAEYLTVFGRAPSDETFQQFKTDCVQAIAEAETHFNNDPSIWHHYMMPLANTILNALNVIASYCDAPAKSKFGLFQSQPSKAKNEWEKIKPRISEVLDSQLLQQTVHKHSSKKG